MAGPEAELKDHRIPLEKGHERGWGRVSIPADANPADNDFWFVFDQPAPRRAIVVAEDPQAARPLQLAASIAPDPDAARARPRWSPPSQLAGVDWDTVVARCSGRPRCRRATRPTRSRPSSSAAGGRSSSRRAAPATPSSSASAGRPGRASRGRDRPSRAGGAIRTCSPHTQSGAPLPVGQLCRSAGTAGSAGEFDAAGDACKGARRSLARAATNRGGAYFCATTPAAGRLVAGDRRRRALRAGAAGAGRRRRGPGNDPAARGRRAAPATTRPAGSGSPAVDEAISTEYPLHRGVYASGDRLLAVNRAGRRGRPPVLADRRVAELFHGLDFARVDDRAGNVGSLIQEIWRLFLVAMMVALVVEAGLCLPKLARRRA